MIVADSGPLIAFFEIGRLDLLQQVMETLTIPDAVYEEIVLGGQGQSRAAEIGQNPWIQRKAIVNRAALSAFPLQLHGGEREAIILAQELGAQLLIDERRGRKAPASEGLASSGACVFSPRQNDSA